MSARTVPVDGKTLDWPRKVANAINWLLDIVGQRETLPFQMLTAAPADPVEGQVYYSTTDHMARVWDGSTWQDLW